jgi:hypothetical protein
MRSETVGGLDRQCNEMGHCNGWGALNLKKGIDCESCLCFEIKKEL